MQDQWTGDQALASIADLADTADALCGLLDQTFGGRQALAHVRDAGRLLLEQIMPVRRRLRVIEDICEAAANLTDARDRFRHAVTRSLYDEGLTMDEIAPLLRVTRQRISAILTGDPRVSSAPAGSPTPGPGRAPAGSRQDIIQRSYEATLLRAAAGRARPRRRPPVNGQQDGQLARPDRAGEARPARKPRYQARTVWTTGQLRAFLKTARRHRLFALFHLAAYTGARRGELLRLRWRDIDLGSGVVRITGADARPVQAEAITGRRRVVSIDTGTVRVLRDHRKRQDAERVRTGPHSTGADVHVFTTARGEPIGPDTASAIMTALINAHNDAHSGQPGAALPHARLLDLRQLHAATLRQAGVPAHVVATRLGHAHPSNTPRVCATIGSDQLARAADVFAQVVENRRCEGLTFSAFPSSKVS